MTTHAPPLVTEADLLAFVDGLLDPPRRAEVEAHLGHEPRDAYRVACDLAILQGLRLLYQATSRWRGSDRAAGIHSFFA